MENISSLYLQFFWCAWDVSEVGSDVSCISQWVLLLHVRYIFKGQKERVAWGEEWGEEGGRSWEKGEGKKGLCGEFTTSLAGMFSGSLVSLWPSLSKCLGKPIPIFGWAYPNRGHVLLLYPGSTPNALY